MSVTSGIRSEVYDYKIGRLSKESRKLYREKLTAELCKEFFEMEPDLLADYFLRLGIDFKSKKEYRVHLCYLCIQISKDEMRKPWHPELSPAELLEFTLRNKWVIQKFKL